VNNIDFAGAEALEQRLRQAAFSNFKWSLPPLLYMLLLMLSMDGFHITASGEVVRLTWKYLLNLNANPILFVSLFFGLALVVAGVLLTAKTDARCGIWAAGLGTVLVGLTVFGVAGFNNTPFYPSKVDLQSSLSIYNASSSRYTLQVMTYVALAIPLVLAYVAYVWRAMDARPLGLDEVTGKAESEAY